MCYGIPIFSNNTKAFHGRKTNSHTTAASALKINEDHYLKGEFHWWNKKYVVDHYDTEGKQILKGNGVSYPIALKLAKQHCADKLMDNRAIYLWLKDVKEEWKHLPEVKDKTFKSYLFTKLVGMTPEENDRKLKEAEQKVNAFVKRVEGVKWFQPEPVIKKRDISLKVNFCLDLFKLPKANIEFHWLDSAEDWSAAESAAESAAWSAARSAAWSAAGIIVADLPMYRKQYKQVPFVPFFELFEMGLFPIGIVGRTFVIYIPLVDGKRPKLV